MELFLDEFLKALLFVDFAAILIVKYFHIPRYEELQFVKSVRQENKN